MKYGVFDEHRFRVSVSNALNRVERIVETGRNPVLAEDDQDHTYDDKFSLTEFLTNTSFAAITSAFGRLGLDSAKLQTVLKSVHDEQRKSITLRFQAQDACSLLETRTVPVKSLIAAKREITTTTTTANSTTNENDSKKTETITTEVITEATEYHWKIDVAYKILLYAGTDVDSPLQLLFRSASTNLITSGSSAPPIPETTIHNPIDTNVTWFFQMISPKDTTFVCQFVIDRDNETCKTPRRNADTEAACEFHRKLWYWAEQVQGFFRARFESEIISKHRPVEQTPDSSGPLSLWGASKDCAKTIFCPTVPLMEKGSVLPMSDVVSFLAEQVRSMDQAEERFSKIYPPAEESGRLVSVAEAGLIMICHHLQSLAIQYGDSVDYVEHMLKNQLAQAIGKEVNAGDFDKFMRFHSQKLFSRPYAPAPFSYAIRRSGKHYPDGMLTIESAKNANEPIQTMVRHIPGSGESAPISVPINAATSLDLTGDRYLHGWLQHRFEESTAPPSFDMICRARQFSGFIILVGSMAGPNEFVPKHAAILQNKDEIKIPLEISMLPTARDFKDAISSLSPEQQAFCRSFRAMQLESSVFGVCIVQIKPQLEKLLGLPAGSLTKEIRLTQDLMSLFIEYQIPSDLLSFDEDDLDESSNAAASRATTAAKVAAVKEHVKAVMDVIDSSKTKQLKGEVQKADMRAEMATARFSVGTLMLQQQQQQQAQVPLACVAAAPAHRFGHSFHDRAAKAASHSFRNEPIAERKMALCKSMPRESTPTTTVANDVDIAESSKNFACSGTSSASGRGDDDFTLVPKLLDAKLEKFDTDNALRSTIVKAGLRWRRTRQANLLTEATSKLLSSTDIIEEKKKAFDLLDALSRSGGLPIGCSELHVFVAASHCFENSVVGTIVQDNINPIEKAEKSALLIASTVHNVEAMNLLVQGEDHRRRLTASFPRLFGSSPTDDDADAALDDTAE